MRAPVLAPDEVSLRARRVRLVVTDVDGVLTDGSVFYGEQGEALMRFSRRDGMGMELLRREGIRVAILSSEDSAITKARASKLGLESVWLGVRDKAAFLPGILAETGVGASEIACIGDDVNDLGILRQLAGEGLTGAPADAVPSVLAAVHWIAPAGGGCGAFRQFADWILDARSGIAGS